MKLLGVNPQLREYRLVFGGTPENDGEIAVQTRSVLQVMTEFASMVDVPLEHLEKGRVAPGLRERKGEDAKRYLLHVRSGDSSPDDAFVAVGYRDHCFWIDDRDLESKRAFVFTMLLFAMADTGERESLPLITVPAGWG